MMEGGLILTSETVLPELELVSNETNQREFLVDISQPVTIKLEGILDEHEENENEIGDIMLNSKRTLTKRRPLPVPKVDLMDVKYYRYQDKTYCSNCYENVTYENHGKKLADILCSRRAKTIKGGGQVFGVTVLEALDVIFELHRKSYLSEVLLDEMEYTICWKCCTILSKLYKLYIEFAECSKTPSYIKSIIAHNKSLKAHHEMINKCIAESHTVVEHNHQEYEDDGHLNFEMSFQEDDSSYFPPAETWAPEISSEEDRPIRNLRKRPNVPKRFITEEGNSVSVFQTSDPIPVKRGRGRPRRIVPPEIVSSATRTSSRSSTMRKKDDRREKDRKMTHKCSECSARFSRPSRLQRHLNVHSGKRYVCKVCDAGFKFPIYLERHEASHSAHNVKEDGCESGRVEDNFEDNGRLKKRNVKVTMAGRTLSKEERRRAHVCRDCGLVFTKPSGLVRHSRVHDNTFYSCDQCDCSARFKSKALLRRHKIKVHEMSPTEADVAKPLRKVIRRRTERENDIFTKPDCGKGKRRYPCPDCPQTFFRTDHIRRHAKVHEERNHICESCQAGFSTIKHLQSHINLLHLEDLDEDGMERLETRKRRIRVYRKYNCTEPDCDLEFTRTNHLKQHLFTKHNIEYKPNQPEEPQTCPVCSLVVKSIARLDNHLQKHRPLIRQNNHECEICGKKYRDANNLRNHKASHRLDKPYICDKCGFATKRSYQLTRHIEMVHVGTRSHLCTKCGVSFKKKQHLRDHELTHNALEYRPFTCTIEGCTKAYRSRRNLRQHLEAHTGCKFQCETCGRIFTRKDNLKVHVDTVHLGKPGRTQKEKAKTGDGSLSPVKRRRKPKQAEVGVTVEEVIHILPDVVVDQEEDENEDEDQESGSSHPVMVVDESNLHQLQQHHQHQHFHHILANPRIQIQQTGVPGQVVAIPNTFGEFFYQFQ